jgi:F-type H+-transporting ATPase subunit gamma
MVAAREVRNKILSVKNTQKITKAMEMVAVSKVRKAQERMSNSYAYSTAIRRLVSHFVLGNPEYKHPYIASRNVQRVGYLVISTNRGLCGGLNINLFKKVLAEMNQWHDKDVESDLAIIGTQGISFFTNYTYQIVAQQSYKGDKPSISDLIGSVKAMSQAYYESRIDKLYIASNQFKNSMSQCPIIAQLLPLTVMEDQYEDIQSKKWDYIYESDSRILINTICDRYVESQVHHSVMENLASEQAARMVAMKSASDKASDLITDLQLAYNKARQASITQELTEIISGASAI